MRLDNLHSIIFELKQRSFKCDSFTETFTNIRKMPVKEHYTKLIINQPSDDVNTIIIDCYDNLIMSIAVNGNIKNNFKQINLEYGNVIEKYSPHDEMYFYSFEIGSESEILQISFYMPSGNKASIDSEENLKNILISASFSK